MTSGAPPRVFVDASVVVAATLRRSGGSGYIFGLGKEGYITLILTHEVIKEARLGIKKKYGKEQLVRFYNLLGGLKENILPTPGAKEINTFSNVISDQKDRHVLAGAKKYKADVLVTLDQRHFFTGTIQNAHLPFRIQLPGDFLREYRQKL